MSFFIVFLVNLCSWFALNCYARFTAYPRDLVAIEGALSRNQIVTAGFAGLFMTKGRGGPCAYLFQHNRLLSRSFERLLFDVILNGVKDP